MEAPEDRIETVDTEGDNTSLAQYARMKELEREINNADSAK